METPTSIQNNNSRNKNNFNIKPLLGFVMHVMKIFIRFLTIAVGDVSVRVRVRL